MNSNNKFTLGIWVIITLLVIAAISLFLPFITADINISVMDIVLGKSVNGQKILSAFSLYSLLTTAAVVLPLVIMLILNLSRNDRIKKYIINLFFSFWFLVGEILLMIIVTVPFDGARWGLGFLLGIITSVALAVVSLVLSFKDKTDKKHKVTVWYKSISTIIMIINIPALFVELTSLIVFREVLLMLSFFNVIALIALFTATAVSCLVTIKGFYGVHKYGAFHFLTGVLSLIAIAGLLYNSGTSGIILGFVLVIFFSLLWGLLGVAAVNVMNKN